MFSSNKGSVEQLQKLMYETGVGPGSRATTPEGSSGAESSVTSGMSSDDDSGVPLRVPPLNFGALTAAPGNPPYDATPRSALASARDVELNVGMWGLWPCVIARVCVCAGDFGVGENRRCVVCRVSPCGRPADGLCFGPLDP